MIQTDSSAFLVSSTGSFAPPNLYPCSAACGLQRDPCSACLAQYAPHKVHAMAQDPSTLPQSSTDSVRRPRQHLRTVYAAFLAALRDRLISDIAEAASVDRRRQVRRYREGFLLGSPFPSEGNMGGAEEEDRWGSDWRHYARMRFVASPIMISLLMLTFEH